MTTVKGRRYKESKEHKEFDEEFGKFHRDRDIDEEHILIKLLVLPPLHRGHVKLHLWGSSPGQRGCDWEW